MTRLNTVLPVLLGLALSLSTLGAGATTPVVQTAAEKGRLDALVPALLAEKRIASISMARISQGRIVYAAAWGDARPGMRATPATLYNIASLTKPLSAEVVLRLAARGEISLDEPMAKYWRDPDLADDPRRDALTPRIALSHRTGFPNWRDGALRFAHAPGEGYGYSGEGFEYMARFVETKTGKPFETLAQRLVFKPAGMRETAYTHRPWFDARMAVPHDGDGAPLPPQIATRAIASDDAFSTPRDYARFLIALHKRQGIDRALAAERVRIHSDRRAELCAAPHATDCPTEAGFGLGWESFLIDGRRYLMHTGMDTGTFTLSYFAPDTGDGLVIFTNSSNGPQAVLPILEAIGQDPAFAAWLRQLAG